MLLCALFSWHFTSAQGVLCTITGRVVDQQRRPLPGVSVYLNNTTGSITDSSGAFSLTGTFPDSAVLHTSFPGFADALVALDARHRKPLIIALAENKELGQITVSATRDRDLHTLANVQIDSEALFRVRGSSLGDALKDVPGLNASQTGPTLSKPIIHGLSGNRILIMNNDVRQEGQQWGSEHAPELDPFIADNITVLKGAASVRYGSDALSGVVLVDPAKLPEQKGITGSACTVGSSNGLAGAASARLQGAFDKSLKGLAWRVQGTLRNAGNFKTPNYYLDNSGYKEYDYSVSLGYNRSRNNFNIFYSSYYIRLGIYVGAESGSVAELQQKFALGEPDIVNSFSKAIWRPYQTVLHQLLKSSASRQLGNVGKIEATFARQNDIRQEFDDLSTANVAAQNSPQLKFQLITHTADLVFTHSNFRGLSGSIGVSGKTSGNIFEGVRPLIPNYRDYNGGIFAIENYSFGKFRLEGGLRYDYRWLRVYERDATSLALYNVTYTYSNATATIGCAYKPSNTLAVNFNTGTAWRAPNIEEMYVNGVHFSDASFDVGDSALRSERSWNSSLSVNWALGKFHIVADAYYNDINNYIYAKPSLTYRQLASGAFPEFDFTQAHVNIKGLDLEAGFEATKQVKLYSRATVVRGYNETIDNWLISMPADRFQNGIEYHLPKVYSLMRPYVFVENVSVLQQSRVPPNSDYVPPPSAYSLMNTGAGCALRIAGNEMDISFKVSNFTNVVYRDYLDHFRYYADELGINYSLKIQYSF